MCAALMAPSDEERQAISGTGESPFVMGRTTGWFALSGCSELSPKTQVLRECDIPARNVATFWAKNEVK
jgi:hypothetical protein